MSDKVLHITDDQFEAEVIKSDKPVLVDFWAPWCGPCKMVGPIIEALAEKMENVKFCKVDIDQNVEWASKLKVMSIPTMVIYKDGEVMASQIGALPEEDLRRFIEANI
ncbi:thioredoxin [Succinatimonas hippei]|uniref:thioredoxin n=1 Tax=Succinatimonas hippei TaxID=626938 RepID=UPI0025E7973F|nr:thioredoxin [Succinatimonas hippei]